MASLVAFQQGAVVRSAGLDAAVAVETIDPDEKSKRVLIDEQFRAA